MGPLTEGVGMSLTLLLALGNFFLLLGCFYRLYMRASPCLIISCFYVSLLILECLFFSEKKQRGIGSGDGARKSGGRDKCGQDVI